MRQIDHALMSWQQLQRATAQLAGSLERRGDSETARLAHEISRQLGELLEHEATAAALARLPESCRTALRRLIGRVLGGPPPPEPGVSIVAFAGAERMAAHQQPRR